MPFIFNRNLRTIRICHVFVQFLLKIGMKYIFFQKILFTKFIAKKFFTTLLIINYHFCRGINISQDIPNKQKDQDDGRLKKLEEDCKSFILMTKETFLRSDIRLFNNFFFKSFIDWIG